MFEFNWGAIDTNLIKMAFALSIYLLWKPSISTKAAITIGLLVFALGKYDPLYQAFVAFWPQKNPQLSTFLYAVFLVPLSILNITWRKRRSADRIIMTVALCSITATTVLFHHFLVTGTLPIWKDQVNREAQAMIMLNDKAFLSACTARGMTCGAVQRVEDLGIQGPILKGLLAIEKDTEERATNAHVLFSYAELNDIRSENIGFITYFADHRGKKIVIDSESAEWAHRTVKQSFYFLGAVAHGSWLLLSLGLMHLHTQASRSKLRITDRSHSPVEHA